jgi:hypothetical protein
MCRLTLVRCPQRESSGNSPPSHLSPVVLVTQRNSESQGHIRTSFARLSIYPTRTPNHIRTLTNPYPNLFLRGAVCNHRIAHAVVVQGSLPCAKWSNMRESLEQLVRHTSGRWLCNIFSCLFEGYVSKKQPLNTADYSMRRVR